MPNQHNWMEITCAPNPIKTMRGVAVGDVMIGKSGETLGTVVNLIALSQPRDPAYVQWLKFVTEYYEYKNAQILVDAHFGGIVYELNA